MTRKTGLPAIVTAARAGALDYANRLFLAGGYDRQNDPAALAVHGRLLKDQALRLPTAQRAEGFRAAARAYEAADRLQPQPYTQINVATLSLLAGDDGKAQGIARNIIGWLDSGVAIPETPYFLGATRAEALLLCGEAEAARQALTAAIAQSPDGWADHASTLRQLRMILDAQREDAGWLDAFRPPRSLYFAGHLGVSSESAGELFEQIDAVIEAENIGFGYGALAAGSDLLVAERLLARGAELHVVLPTLPADFQAQSVVPFGEDWASRFAACIDAASSVRSTAHVTGDYEPLATQLAGDVAMGATVLNARQLESEAVQLVILDDGDGAMGDGLNTIRDAERWAVSGRRQYRIRWPRIASVIASGRKPVKEGRDDRRLAAMLHISFAGLDALDEEQFAEAIDTVIAPFRTASLAFPVQPEVILPSGNARIVGFSTPEAAWAYARALFELPVPTLPLRIAGHYALAHWLEAPPALAGRGVAELAMLATSCIPGVLTVSEFFASALFAVSNDQLQAEWVGELGEMRLFTVGTV